MHSGFRSASATLLPIMVKASGEATLRSIAPGYGLAINPGNSLGLELGPEGVEAVVAAFGGAPQQERIPPTANLPALRSGPGSFRLPFGQDGPVLPASALPWGWRRLLWGNSLQMEGCKVTCFPASPMNCSIVPPYLLSRIAERPDRLAAAADAARRTLMEFTSVAETRQLGRTAKAPSSGTAFSPKLRRTVFDAMQRQELPGREVRAEGAPDQRGSRRGRNL